MVKQGEALKNLRESGYRLTPQRRCILEKLASSGRHMSAEELYRAVKKRYPNIGLATVYRTLDLLKDLGWVKEGDFGEGHRHFEANPDHHHHLVCLSCGRIEEFGERVLDQFQRELEERFRFEVVDHCLEFYGYCSSCKRRKKGSCIINRMG